MSKQVKLTDEAYEVLAAAEGNSFSDKVLRLASSNNVNERLDKLGIYLKEQFERIGGGRTDIESDPKIKWEEKQEPTIPPELEGLGADELPECCQGIYGAGKPTCPHWEKAWVKEYGNRVIGYKNTLTGRAASDPTYYKYV